MEGLVRDDHDARADRVGGVYCGGELHGAIKIPDGLSILLHGSTRTRRSPAWTRCRRADRPPVASCTSAFDTMVGIGFALLASAAGSPGRGGGGASCRAAAWFLRAVAVSGVAAVVAMESGWITTEVGRQPWIVYGLLRVADAVNPAPGHRRTALAGAHASTPC